MHAAIHVELSRTVDAPSVAEALASRGLPVEVVADGSRAEVLVGPNGGDAATLRDEVSSALEAWTATCRAALVATPVGADAFSVHPAAA